ncbi:phage tail tube protein [Paenibacillus thailandensis]|uniref:Phage tail tube protein n=1 Tax=Paenibacillus thailandensis TaxID=393250 RepID=A0ABW5R2M1_9BACL
MSNLGNEVVSGDNGQVWINGEEWAGVSSFEVKTTLNFSEVRQCNDPNAYQVYNGRTCEGTLTVHKTSSRGAKIMAEAARTGIMPNIKIVSKIQNKQTGKAERAIVHNVVFTEFTHRFEQGTSLTEELPFKCSHITYEELM